MASPAFTIRSSSLLNSGKKYFTLAEARRALPLVRRVAQDVQVVQASRLRIHAQLNATLPPVSTQQQIGLQDEFDRATARLESLIAELQLIGVELKDPSRGLLDFPAIHQGREVLLCWKGDEEDIAYWHEVDSGFAGRKPASLLEQ